MSATSSSLDGIAFVGSISEPAVLIAVAGSIALTATVLFMVYLALAPYVTGTGPTTAGQTTGDGSESKSRGAGGR